LARYTKEESVAWDSLGGVILVGFGWNNLKYDLENEKPTSLIM
jgi:hypothetical protein